MNRLRNYVLAFLMLGFMMAGCQRELEEITRPDDKTFAPDSRLANLMNRVSSHDGSFDNILDKSSCVSVVLPVTVTANGQQVVIESKDDLKKIERIFNASSADVDTVEFQFPITVITATHATIVINSADALKDLVKDCVEGGGDDDIECLDFKYPITFSVYNSNTQQTKVVTIQDDKALFTFLKNLDSKDVIGFKFPVVVILPEGVEQTITDNKQLEDVIDAVEDACDEDDDNDVDTTPLVNVLISGSWKITYFFDGTDNTSEFKDFSFTFSANKAAVATDGSTVANGTWVVYGDDGLELGLDFDSQSPFDEISEDWDLIEFNATTIKLQHDRKSGTEISYLHFEKI